MAPISKYAKQVDSNQVDAYIKKYQTKQLENTLYNSLQTSAPTPPPPQPTSIDWLTWGLADSSKSLKAGEVFVSSYIPAKTTKAEDIIIPASPMYSLDNEMDEFHIQKVKHPDPLHSYNDLEIVLSQLIEMITTAQAKGIEVPKMMLRVYHRLFHLEQQVKEKSGSEKYYKNGYMDGYNDGWDKLPSAYNTPDEDEVPLDDPEEE